MGAHFESSSTIHVQDATASSFNEPGWHHSQRPARTLNSCVNVAVRANARTNTDTGASEERPARQKSRFREVSWSRTRPAFGPGPPSDRVLFPGRRRLIPRPPGGERASLTFVLLWLLHTVAVRVARDEPGLPNGLQLLVELVLSEER